LLPQISFVEFQFEEIKMFAEAYYSWHKIARFNGIEQTNSPMVGSAYEKVSL